MSELWICEKQIAEKPFHLEAEGIDIWTIEELCFYLYHNIEQLDEDFIEESLLFWIRYELKLPGLAETVMEEKKQGKNYIWCSWFLLKEVGLYTEEELAEMKELCLAMNNKDDFECQKLRADRLIQGKKYLRSIRQYEQLLQISEKSKQYQGLLGDIHHNMGVAYAGLFLYREAAECFKIAFQQNQKQESQRAYEEALLLLTPMEEQESRGDFYSENIDWDELLKNLRDDYKKKVM